MGKALDTLSAAGRDLYNRLANIFGADNIIVTSTKRPGDNGQHGGGDALDFRIKGMSDKDAYAIIKTSGIPYNQLIWELKGPANTGPHLHIGAGTDGENLIYRNGVYEKDGYSVANAGAGTTKDWAKEFFMKTNPFAKALGIDTVSEFDALQTPVNEVIGRGVVIVIGTVFVILAIAVFVFKSDTAKDIVNKAIPATG